MMPAVNLRVGRWGDSLAVVIPEELARQLDVAEGSTLRVEIMGPPHMQMPTALPSFDVFLTRNASHLGLDMISV